MVLLQLNNSLIYAVEKYITLTSICSFELYALKTRIESVIFLKNEPIFVIIDSIKE